MQDKIILNVGFLIILLTSFFVFYDTFLFQVLQKTNQHWVSDVPVHTQMIQNFSEKNTFPLYSVWYRLVQVISGFSASYKKLVYMSIVLLTSLVGIKYFINYLVLQSAFANKKLTIFISFALCFVMPIVSYYTHKQYPYQILVNNLHVYLGNIAPNQWHNSTLILAMPFYILLFYYSAHYIYSKKLYHFFVMGCFSITLPILTLFYQWYFTFLHNDLFTHPTSTILAPFVVWKTYSPHPCTSLILSTAFPLAILMFYYKRIDRYVILSWLIFLVALAIFLLFAEYPIYLSANYYWGVIAANYILFLSSSKILLNQPLDLKATIAYLILGMHFLSGLILLGSFFINQTPLLI